MPASVTSISTTSCPPRAHRLDRAFAAAGEVDPVAELGQDRVHHHPAVGLSSTHRMLSARAAVPPWSCAASAAAPASRGAARPTVAVAENVEARARRALSTLRSAVHRFREPPHLHQAEPRAAELLHDLAVRLREGPEQAPDLGGAHADAVVRDREGELQLAAGAGARLRP